MSETDRKEAKAQIQVAQAQQGAAPTTEGGATSPTAPPTGGSPGGLGPTANTLALPSGQPQAMGTGEPLTGEQGFPLEFINAKPFQRGMTSIEQMQGAPAGGESVPGRPVVKAEDLGVDQSTGLWPIGLVTIPEPLKAGARWLYDRAYGLEGNKTFGILWAYHAGFVLMNYPFDVPAKPPSESLP